MSNREFVESNNHSGINHMGIIQKGTNDGLDSLARIRSFQKVGRWFIWSILDATAIDGVTSPIMWWILGSEGLRVLEFLERRLNIDHVSFEHTCADTLGKTGVFHLFCSDDSWACWRKYYGLAFSCLLLIKIVLHLSLIHI